MARENGYMNFCQLGSVNRRSLSWSGGLGYMNRKHKCALNIFFSALQTLVFYMCIKSTWNTNSKTAFCSKMALLTRLLNNISLAGNSSDNLVWGIYKVYVKYKLIVTSNGSTKTALLALLTRLNSLRYVYEVCLNYKERENNLIDKANLKIPPILQYTTEVLLSALTLRKIQPVLKWWTK